MIAVNSFKQTYFGTVFGYVWSLARPLLLFAVMVTVFSKVLRLDTIPHYPVFLLMNIVLFGFFQEATGISVTSIVAQESIVRKTQFPRLVIPLSVVLTALFNLGLNLVVVLAFLLGFGVSPLWTWLLSPVLVVLLLVITIAVSMILSSLYPRFRDVAIIWQVLRQRCSTQRRSSTPPTGSATTRRCGNPRAQPAVADLRARAQVDHRAGCPLADNRFGRDAGAAGVDRDLPCDLRVRGLDLPPRGAPDR